jgi:hypothetical protein
MSSRNHTALSWLILACAACASKKTSVDGRRPSGSNVADAGAVAALDAAPAPDAPSAPDAAVVQHRCSDGLKRALAKAAKLAKLPDGEIEDSSSAEVAQVAYFVTDADIRLPELAIHIESESAKPSSARTAAWTQVPGLPDWFAGLKPAAPAMPISWPNRHLELHRAGVRGDIVMVQDAKAAARTLEDGVVECIEARRE